MHNKKIILLAMVFSTIAIAVSVAYQFYNIFSFSQSVENLKFLLYSSNLDKMEILKLQKDIISIEKDKMIAANGISASIIPMMGVIGLAITSYIGYKNFRVAEDKQVTERFSKAIEHIANDKIDICLGGIYEIEQVMYDSPHNYHWRGVKFLSAFVRERQKIISYDQNSPFDNQKVDTFPIHIQAALSIIFNRDLSYDQEFVDLRAVNLSYSKLQECQLYRTNLSNSILVAVNFDRSDLSEINLSNSNLTGASFVAARLDNANLSKANISKADFTNATLNGAFLDEVESSKAIFWNAYLIRANLQKANLRGTNFHNAKLIDAYLYKTDFTNAIVNSVDFSNASMREANFTQANLNDSLFKKVYLWQADFTDSLLIDTDFISTNIDAAKNLTKDQLKYARIDN